MNWEGPVSQSFSGQGREGHAARQAFFSWPSNQPHHHVIGCRCGVPLGMLETVTSGRKRLSGRGGGGGRRLGGGRLGTGDREEEDVEHGTGVTGTCQGFTPK